MNDAHVEGVHIEFAVSPCTLVVSGFPRPRPRTAGIGVGTMPISFQLAIVPWPEQRRWLILETRWSLLQGGEPTVLEAWVEARSDEGSSSLCDATAQASLPCKSAEGNAQIFLSGLHEGESTHSTCIQVRMWSDAVVDSGACVSTVGAKARALARSFQRRIGRECRAALEAADLKRQALTDFSSSEQSSLRRAADFERAARAAAACVHDVLQLCLRDWRTQEALQAQRKAHKERPFASRWDCTSPRPFPGCTPGEQAVLCELQELGVCSGGSQAPEAAQHDEEDVMHDPLLDSFLAGQEESASPAASLVPELLAARVVAKEGGASGYIRAAPRGPLRAQRAHIAAARTLAAQKQRLRSSVRLDAAAASAAEHCASAGAGDRSDIALGSQSEGSTCDEPPQQLAQIVSGLLTAQPVRHSASFGQWGEFFVGPLYAPAWLG